mgnify:CR=1 FL=1
MDKKADWMYYGIRKAGKSKKEQDLTVFSVRESRS